MRKITVQNEVDLDLTIVRENENLFAVEVQVPEDDTLLSRTTFTREGAIAMIAALSELVSVDTSIRDQILGFVSRNPGCRWSDIRESIPLVNTGSMTNLVNTGRVRTTGRQGTKRYWPAD